MPVHVPALSFYGHQGNPSFRGITVAPHTMPHGTLLLLLICPCPSTSLLLPHPANGPPSLLWCMQDRVAIVATRAIAAGQELTYDYNLESFGTFAPACHCGSSKCTGKL